ncbi:MAG: hypothetical protein ACOCXA_04535, partial [Planctomycetota bacterium]
GYQGGQRWRRRALNQEIAWWWWDGRMPDDWECVRYKNWQERGQLEFCNRAGLQAIYTWRRVEKAVDLRRTAEAMHKEWLQREAPERLAGFGRLDLRERGDFQILWDVPSDPAHLLRYLPDQRMLLHWLSTDPDPDKVQRLLEPMVASYQRNDGEHRRWRLLGIAADLPKSFEPVEIQAIPANVHIAFEGPRHLHLPYRRLGLAESHLLQNDLFSFYGPLQKRLWRKVYGREDLTWRGHEAVRLQIEQRGQYALEKLTGRWWRGEALMWHDRPAKRLYALEQVGPKRAKRVELDHVCP